MDKINHENHWATCNYCGWVGKESELAPDPNGHPCGLDQCPECKETGNITCCFKNQEEAENG